MLFYPDRLKFLFGIALVLLLCNLSVLRENRAIWLCGHLCLIHGLVHRSSEEHQIVFIQFTRKDITSHEMGVAPHHTFTARVSILLLIMLSALMLPLLFYHQNGAISEFSDSNGVLSASFMPPQGHPNKPASVLMQVNQPPQICVFLTGNNSSFVEGNAIILLCGFRW
ncbi:MAG: hypothetical protein R3A44_17455 [Caldilineaceae bacterium]